VCGTGAMAAVKGGSSDSRSTLDSATSIDTLDAKEAKVFAAMRSFGAKKRRKTAPIGPTSMHDDEL
jgi:hypothetical protein